MPESVQLRINQQEALTNTGKYVVTKPTSPEQIHDETVAKIVPSLISKGHRVTAEDVKVDQTFHPTPQLKQSGMEPSGGEASVNDMLRIITDEIEGNSQKGTVVSEGRLPTAIGAYRRRLKQEEMKEAA